ncbi:hypothetical protein GCM10027610_045170 [Dactylosporangium cerinum]
MLCGAAAGITAILFVALVTGAGGPIVAQNTSNVALFAAALAAAWGCFAKALRPVGRRVRSSWTLTGLGAFSWAVGQLFCIWYETILGTEVPFPSLADAGYFWMMPFTAAGLLLLLPMSRQSVAQQARSILDGLMIAASLLLITWVLILGPLARQGADSFLALLVTLWYPGGDVVVLTVVLFMVARLRSGGQRPMSMPLVGTGLAAFTVSDSGYAYLTLIDNYGSGAVLDLGWFVGFVLILLASRKPDGQHEAENPAALTRPLGLMLPYIAVLGALVTSSLEVLRHGAHDPVVSWTRSAIILLIVGRQLLTLLENRNLTRDLEDRVEARTAELRASEQRFQALVQHSSDVVTVVALDGAVTYQSESIQRVFGYPREHITGQRILDFLGEEARDRLEEAFGAVSETPTPAASWRSRCATPTGTSAWPRSPSPTCSPTSACRASCSTPATSPNARSWRTSSSTRRSTTASPNSPTGPCSRTGSSSRCAAAATPTSPCCSWTWTGSRRSTTASGTPPATSSSSRSPTGSPPRCAPATPWPASAATSSRSSSMSWGTPTTPTSSPPGSSTPWTGSSTSTTPRSTSRAPSASR